MNALVQKKKPPLPRTPEIRQRISRLAAQGNSVSEITQILQADYTCRERNVRSALDRATAIMMEAGMTSAIQRVASDRMDELYSRASDEFDDEDPHIRLKAISVGKDIVRDQARLFGIGNAKVTAVQQNNLSISDMVVNLPQQNSTQLSGAKAHASRNSNNSASAPIKAELLPTKT